MNSLEAAASNLSALEDRYLLLSGIFKEFVAAALKVPEWKDAKRQPLLKTLHVADHALGLQVGIGMRKFAVAFDTRMGKHALMGVLRLVRLGNGLGLEDGRQVHEWYFDQRGAMFADVEHVVALMSGDDPCNIRDADHARAFLLELLEKFGFA